MISESKATRLASHIQTMIEQRGLEPGTFVGTKSDLLEQYKVAAGTLNEALRLLQSRGYLVVKPGPKGGAFVAEAVNRLKLSKSLLSVQDDPQRLEEYFHMQDTLQEQVSVSAAAACTPVDATRISAALSTLRAATSPAETLNAIWKLDREIALTSTNRTMSDIYCLMLNGIRDLVIHRPTQTPGTAHMAKVHEDLADAVMRNDIDAARSASREHSPIDYTLNARDLLSARKVSRTTANFQ